VIDSRLRPKAAYYFARRFFSPVLVSIRRTGAGLEIWITSDLPVPARGTLEVSLVSFEGKTVLKEKDLLRVESDASVRIRTIHWNDLRAYDLKRYYVLARFAAERGDLSENRHYFVEQKHIGLPDPGLSVSVARTGGTSFAVTLRAKKLARDVRLEVEGTDVEFDDNVFDIDGGSVKTVHCRSEISLWLFRKRLNVSSQR
jgi:beta-mannosidase